MDFHTSVDMATLVVLLGILVKGVKMANQLEMMWTVFAHEHGLDGQGKKKDG